VRGRLEGAARKGLIFSILKSREPVSLELGFRSPYGYTVAGLIVEYDYRVRQVKTLVRKDLMTDDEGRKLIREVTRRIRGVFETPVRFERYLIRQELRELSRTDWLPGADAEAGKRVQGGDRHLRRGTQGGLHRRRGAPAYPPTGEPLRAGARPAAEGGGGGPGSGVRRESGYGRCLAVSPVMPSGEVVSTWGADIKGFKGKGGQAEAWAREVRARLAWHPWRHA
jgi:hypothetical protein